MRPKISIIIPVYNGENYLSRCLDSAIKQTYNNYELIIVNDGSRDGSLEICQKYAEKYDNIKIVDKENGGVSTARNTGMVAAQGEYILFLDCDDWMEPDILKKMINTCSLQTDLVISGVAFQTFRNNKLIKKEIKSITKKTVFDSSAISIHYWNLFDNNYLSSCCSKLIRAEIIKENNLQFDPNLIVFEDLVFSLKVIEKCRTVVAIPEPLYNYYLNADKSAFQKRFNKNIYLNMSKVCDYIDSFINNIEIEKEEDFLNIKQFNFNLMLNSIDGVFIDHNSLEEEFEIIRTIVNLDSVKRNNIGISSDSWIKKLIKYSFRHKYYHTIYLLMRTRYIKKTIKNRVNYTMRYSHPLLAERQAGLEFDQEKSINNMRK